MTVKELRKKVHSKHPELSRKEAFEKEAEYFDISYTTLYAWIKTRRIPTLEQLNKFCNRYGITPNDFYSFKPQDDCPVKVWEY